MKKMFLDSMAAYWVHGFSLEVKINGQWRAVLDIKAKHILIECPGIMWTIPVKIQKADVQGYRVSNSRNE